jgi:hypothetical protein
MSTQRTALKNAEARSTMLAASMMVERSKTAQPYVGKGRETELGLGVKCPRSGADAGPHHR